MYIFYTKVHLEYEKFNDVDFILVDKDFTQNELKKFFENYRQKQKEKYKYLIKQNSYYGDPIYCWFQSINPIKESYLK